MNDIGDYLAASEALYQNNGQLAAYNSTDHCVVLAGPGSGKTKTLTIKLARMLAEDVRSPQGVSCITYSGSCAEEIRSRLRRLGVKRSKGLFIGTVHSFCFTQIARPYAAIAGDDFPVAGIVASSSKQTQIFREALMNVVSVDENPSNWRTRVEKYRRTHLNREHKSWFEGDQLAAEINDEFRRLLRLRAMIDFDDMVECGLRLVEGCQWVRRAIRARFPILVVDEYQDLGWALDRLVRSLCFESDVRLFAVGDPDQSIYGFTGAQPNLLRQLAERSDVETISLKLNYRSGATIIKASEAILKDSKGYKSESEDVGTIDVHPVAGGLDEQVNLAVNSIIPNALLRRTGRNLGDIAILYKDRNDGKTVAGCVEESEIKFFRVDGGSPIPRTPLMSWMQRCAKWCTEGWNKGEPRLEEIVSDWLNFNRSVSTDSGRRDLRMELIRVLWRNRDTKIGLHQWLNDDFMPNIFPRLNAQQEMQDECENVCGLVEKSALEEDLGSMTLSGFGKNTLDTHSLNLVTLHSAKGLEYDVVIIVGCEEGQIPHYRAKTAEALNEQRRLFYVGVTRAKHEVHLLHSHTRSIWGTTRNMTRSRFVDEVIDAIK